MEVWFKRKGYSCIDNYLKKTGRLLLWFRLLRGCGLGLLPAPLVLSLALSIPFYLLQNRILVYTIVKITSATSVTSVIVLMMFKERSEPEGRVESILLFRPYILPP